MDRKGFGKRGRKATFRKIAIGLMAAAGLCLCFHTGEASAKVYRTGFSWQKLSPDIKKRIRGVSYHKNNHISYSDLRYITVRYYDFNGKVKTGELIVNRKIAKKTVKIFYELYQLHYPFQRMKLIDEYGADDDKSMAANNTSAFNYRTIEGSKKLSNHALGLAIDINPRINPYVEGSKVSPVNAKVYANRNKRKCRGKYGKWMIKKNDKIVKIFKKYGFSWGGDWIYSKDYQHFDYRK